MFEKMPLSIDWTDGFFLFLYPLGFFTIFINFALIFIAFISEKIVDKKQKLTESKKSHTIIMNSLYIISIVIFPLAIMTLYISFYNLHNLYNLRKNQKSNLKQKIPRFCLVLSIISFPVITIALIYASGSLPSIIYVIFGISSSPFFYYLLNNKYNTEKMREWIVFHEKSMIAVSFITLFLTGSLFVYRFTLQKPKRISNFENPNESFQLRVMTYNIRRPSFEQNPLNNWDNRKQHLVEYIDSFNLDLLGVQEATFRQLHYIVSHLQPSLYRYYGVGRADGAYGDEYSAIIFRMDKFQALDGGTFWLSSTPNIPSATWGNLILRICTWVRLEHLETKKQFFALNMHFDFSTQFQINAAQLIQKFIFEHTGKLPVLLMGDFNLNYTKETYAYLDGYGNKPLQDSYKLIHGTPIPLDYSMSQFNASYIPQIDRRIDFIFVSADIQAMNISIPKDSYSSGLTYSDHYPVFLNCLV